VLTLNILDVENARLRLSDVSLCLNNAGSWVNNVRFCNMPVSSRLNI
jgi:hypothetical protein